jgi:hypothetical protein
VVQADRKATRAGQIKTESRQTTDETGQDNMKINVDTECTHEYMGHGSTHQCREEWVLIPVWDKEGYQNGLF